MTSDRHDFALGLTLIAFVGLFLGSMLFIYPRFGKTTRPIEIHFDHVRGVAPLKAGSLVLLSGALPVGKVTQVQRRLVADESAGEPSRLIIVVHAQIESDLTLYEDCLITTQQPPVGGGGTVVISSVGTPGGNVVEGTPIVGLPPESFAAAIGDLSRQLLGPGGLVEKLNDSIDRGVEGSLMNRLLASLEDINAMTTSLRSQLDVSDRLALLSKVHRIFDDLNATAAALREHIATGQGDNMMAKVNSALERLQSALAEADEMLRENRPALHSTLTSLESTSRQLDRELIGALVAEFDRTRPDALISKIHSGIENLNQSFEDIAAITETGKGLVVLNRPALQKTIDNLKVTSDLMRRGIEELLLAPWRLFQPPDSELKRLDVFDAARRFAEAATQMDDTTARLQAVLVAEQSGGKSLQSQQDLRDIRDALRAAFERFEQAEEYFWDKIQ